MLKDGLLLLPESSRLFYKSNLLLKQQAEIVDFADKDNKPDKWGKIEIDQRYKKIVTNFAIPKWSFDKIKTNR